MVNETDGRYVSLGVESATVRRASGGGTWSGFLGGGGGLFTGFMLYLYPLRVFIPYRTVPQFSLVRSVLQ